MNREKVLSVVVITLFILAAIIASIQYQRLKDDSNALVPTSSDSAGGAASAANAENSILADGVVFGLNGKRILISSYRGKWLLLNFWATWCGPCREEMPDLDRVYKREHPAGLQMLGVSAENPGDVSLFMLAQPPGQMVSYPIATDPAGELKDALQTQAIPRTIVLNPKGEVVIDSTGMANYKAFINGIRKVGFPVR
ncbi:MAG TPA: TlpA disulfide reductase family protein [Armatimonadota bacterium]|nr:TlpA disulfide reductase family protein [Armatimonadota bacterium]